MKVQSLPIARLNPAPYNPRRKLKPGDSAYERLRKSINAFGAVEPLVWNQRTGHVVGGHQRLQVLRDLGHEQVDVVAVDLPPEKEKALNLALNKIEGGWDERALAELLNDLADRADLDIEATGFDLPEIEKLTADLRNQIEQPEDAVTVPTAEAAAPVTEPGELIELGEHRLLCGDAADPRAWQRLLGDERAHMAFADPPFGVDYRASRRPIPGAQPKRDRRSQRPLRGDSQGHAKYQRWLRPILTHLVETLTPGGAIYLWVAHQQLGFASDALVELDCHVSTILTWAKDWAAPAYSDFKPQTEHAIYAWRRGAKRRFHGPRNASTLWQVPRERTDGYLHPTQKPLELAQRAIRYSSRPGDLILDPFLGSGTTLIAAARHERRCYGIEIEPAYCDAIVRRYIAAVGPGGVDSTLSDRYAGAKGACSHD